MKDSNFPIQIYSYSIYCINYLIFFDGWSNFVVSFPSMHYFSLISASYTHYHNPLHSLGNCYYSWHSIFFYAWITYTVRLNSQIILSSLSFFIASIHITLIVCLTTFLFLAHISFCGPNISFIAIHFFDHSLSMFALNDLLILLRSILTS